jgi:type IV pilus assembly protein PilB
MLSQRLSEQLTASGLLTHEQVQEAMTQAGQDNVSMVSVLLRRGMPDSRKLAHLIAVTLSCPEIDLASIHPGLYPRDETCSQIAAQYQVLPLYLAADRNTLTLAIADPACIAHFDTIRFRIGLHPEAVVADAHQLRTYVQRYLGKEEKGTVEDAGGDARISFEAATEACEADDAMSGSTPEAGETDEAPVARAVNEILLNAVRNSASDIHMEPGENGFRIRYRKDGLLREVSRPPVNVARRMVARLKVLGNLDITERRLPQDGRLRIRLPGGQAIDFRMSTLPVLWGEKIVLRILDSSSARLDIHSLGYDPVQQDLYLQALQRKQGLILVTGPTGSGKTVSLYTGLSILNTLERNISTAEDPVEINLPGINQVAVSARNGLDFAAALKAFMRQDPDVVMLGEIRDRETAEIAIKAAQTGHLVLSTLHTNSAAETVSRLLNMGIAQFNLADSLSLIIAQRLARRLCTSCRQAEQVDQQVLLQAGMSTDMIESATLFSAGDCEHCDGGYRGRLGIVEILSVTPAISELINAGATTMEIVAHARHEGFRGLRDDAMQKVAQGLTSLSEAERIL